MVQVDGSYIVALGCKGKDDNTFQQKAPATHIQVGNVIRQGLFLDNETEGVAVNGK